MEGGSLPKPDSVCPKGIFTQLTYARCRIREITGKDLKKQKSKEVADLKKRGNISEMAENSG
jgi:hypothetical protein